jgi:NAD-dependent SIR2 family protein deacetylase
MVDAVDRNVFILGAGFSANAGAPLVKDFLDRSRELMDDPSSGLEPFERAHFSEVFRFRREMAQAREKVMIDLDNIEELFGLVEMSQRLGDDTRKTRNSTVYMIAKTLELATRPPGRGRFRVRFDVRPEFAGKSDSVNRGSVFQPQPGYPAPLYGGDIYDYFASLASGRFDDPETQPARTNTFITFNYDLVLDHALQRLNFQPDYALDPSLTQVFELPDAQQQCLLLKLHGSSNWGVCGNCLKEVLILQGKVSDSPRQFQSRRCSRCSQEGFQPLLIPPSWDKSEYQAIMTRVWARAVAELKSATRICIIGYSMPQSDLFFRYLLTLALAQNHGLYKLVVVDKRLSPAPPSADQGPPAPGGLEGRYRELLDPLFRQRRFSFYPHGFETFMVSGNQACVALGRGEMLGGNIGYY